MSNLVDSDAIPARQFVEYAFGQLKSLNDMDGSEGDKNSSLEDSLDTNLLSEDEEGDDDRSSNKSGSIRSESNLWDSFPDIVSQNIVQKLGLPSPKKWKLDGMDILEKIGLQSRKTAEAGYIESGLATADAREVDNEKEGGQLTTNAPKSSITDMKNATEELLRQADNVFGALMVLKAVVPQLSKNGLGTEKVSEKNGGSGVRDDFSRSSQSEKLSGLVNVDGEDEKNAEEMKTLFSSAESAMEAWAMLATAMGHPSFIKSEFEKLCFLDNEITDTQVKTLLLVY